MSKCVEQLQESLIAVFANKDFHQVLSPVYISEVLISLSDMQIDLFPLKLNNVEKKAISLLVSKLTNRFTKFTHFSSTVYLSSSCHDSGSLTQCFVFVDF